MEEPSDASWGRQGYRGFQQKFAPMVVRRALLLDGDQPFHRKVPSHALYLLSVEVFCGQVFAPAYAMAFFHAHKKRKALEFPFIGIFPWLQSVEFFNRFSWSYLRQCHGA